MPMLLLPPSDRTGEVVLGQTPCTHVQRQLPLREPVRVHRRLPRRVVRQLLREQRRDRARKLVVHRITATLGTTAVCLA